MSTIPCLSPQQLSKQKPSTNIFFNALTNNTNEKNTVFSTTTPKQPSCSLPTIHSYMTPSDTMRNLVRPL